VSGTSMKNLIAISIKSYEKPVRDL